MERGTPDEVIKRFKLALDSANLGLWEYDFDKGKLTWDESMLKIYGVSGDVFDESYEFWLGKVFSEDREEVQKKINEAIKGLTPFFDTTFRITLPDQSTRWVKAKAKVYKDDDQRSVGMIGASWDITYQQIAEEKLRQSEESFRGAFEHSAIGMALVGLKGEWIQVNNSLCKMVGYSKEELLNLTFQDITHPDDLEKDLTLLQELIDGKRQSYQLEKRYFHKQGHMVWIILAVSMVDDQKGNPLYFVSQITDISLRKKFQLELEQTLEKLEKHSNELEKKNKELEQFTYIASHDLREPLNTIMSFLKVIKEEYNHAFVGEVHEMFGFIDDSAQRMNALVKDLLEFTRLGSREDFKRVNMKKLVNDVIQDLRDMINETQCEITVKDLPDVLGHYHQIRVLIQNLFSNSVKFTKEGEKPKIKMGYKEAGKQFKFYVQDNGIGIDKKHHEKIFQIFQRLNSREKYEGTGLGLANCRKIVHLHDGEMWVESEPGSGSTFFFTLNKY